MLSHTAKEQWPTLPREEQCFHKHTHLLFTTTKNDSNNDEYYTSAVAAHSFEQGIRHLSPVFNLAVKCQQYGWLRVQLIYLSQFAS